MNLVTKLKKKHRNSLWRDEDGDIWFYNRAHRAWESLTAYQLSDKPGTKVVEYDSKPHHLAVEFTRIHEWNT